MGQLIPRLQQSWTRQLAWSLFSPDLFLYYPSPFRPDAWSIEWLWRLDQLESDDPEFPRRLGFRFEQLLERYLIDHPEWQLLGRNIQIHDDNRTIGELDFIALYLPDGQAWHIEAAVKFYLQTPWGWYGPDVRDTLLQKYLRMKNHQLRLHEHPAARSQLDHYGISQNLASAMHAKGWLFGYEGQCLLPDYVNPAIQTGNWELAAKWPYGRAYLDKSSWLDPIAMETDYSFETVEGYPIMINHNGQRQFLVPEIWLQNIEEQNNGQTV
ncbi:hypothetical protein YC6258_03202 [Gynuella sunshinyii YC6258]|uniref:DUF1853 family protein n=2 Tax=Gynuella sunshinyii TaxID=1445505 RepID=A0A0C5VPG0_9GAMM|nr:hypothetical protein YC6258_03202 [Gynuella sunshinyii YC6258]